MISPGKALVTIPGRIRSSTAIAGEEYTVKNPGSVKSLTFRRSLSLFLVLGLFAALAQYVLFPALMRLGISEENAYNTAHLTVFVGLFVATFLALRAEGTPLAWGALKERLRLRPMDVAAWKWTLPFLGLYLVLGLLFNMLAQFVYEQLGFWPPDADIPLTNVAYLLILLPINVLSEELWWRGYLLPRQELEHRSWAWVVNAVLWSLFHFFKWWAVPFLLLKQWMLPVLVQRTRNTTPAILIHLVSNGIGVLLSILPLLTA
jgi:membrane protease YdiL (CAAX protease family)